MFSFNVLFKGNLKVLAFAGLLASGVASADALQNYVDSTQAINNFLLQNPELRTYDGHVCHVNVQSEWRADLQRFKLVIQLVDAELGEVANFGVDSISLVEQQQSHIVWSTHPLRMDVFTYIDQAGPLVVQSAKKLELSPYAIRISDVDPASGENFSYTYCQVPGLPL